MAETRLTAKDLERLLSAKHAGDIFVSECKTGPSQMASKCPRLDGWVLKKSWANPQIIGYEIKVSRSDFLQDNKWPDYLEFCNELYFVTPKGLVQTSEIPHDCGLVEASTNGKRLFIKKAAPYRDVQIPDSIFRYILMCRVRITREVEPRSREWWKKWLEERHEDKAVGNEIAYMLSRATTLIYEENRTAKRELESAERTKKYVQDILSQFGITDAHIGWHTESALKRKIEALQKIKDGGHLAALESALTAIKELK